MWCNDNSFSFSENSRRLWLSKFLAGKVFRQLSTLLENSSLIFQEPEMLSLPRFGHFPVRKTAAGKSAAPGGTLLDFLLRPPQPFWVLLTLGVFPDRCRIDDYSTLSHSAEVCSCNVILIPSNSENAEGGNHGCKTKVKLMLWCL